MIWLHFQDCTGCTESLLRTSKPDLADLILHVISLDYHETLMAACGHQAEAALDKAVKDNAGEYVLVVEGSIPTKDQGVYMKLAGKPALNVLKDVAAQGWRHYCHRIMRIMGRHSFGRPQPDGRCWRGRHH